MNRIKATDMFRKVFKSFLSAALLTAMGAAVSAADFDRDGKADFAVFRPSSTTWISESSGAKSERNSSFQWGHANDVLVPADFDGDGQTDFAVWRPANGVWYVHQSGDDSVLLVRWGTAILNQVGGQDVPVTGDYDADGQADMGLWRPATGEWRILKSSNGYDQDNAIVYRWGKPGDVPVQADYDGDKKTDFAVFRSTESRWHIRSSSTGKSSVQAFGIAGLDTLVPADYTGDKKADIAIYRGGVWHVLNSESGETEQFHLGFSDDVAVPADYDGDGTTDFATYRSGTWYVYDSSRPRLRTFNLGQVNDVPVNSGVVRQSIVAIP